MLLPLKEFRSLDLVKDQMQGRLHGSKQIKFAEVNKGKIKSSSKACRFSILTL